MIRKLTDPQFNFMVVVQEIDAIRSDESRANGLICRRHTTKLKWWLMIGLLVIIWGSWLQTPVDYYGSNVVQMHHHGISVEENWIFMHAQCLGVGQFSSNLEVKFTRITLPLCCWNFVTFCLTVMCRSAVRFVLSHFKFHFIVPFAHHYQTKGLRFNDFNSDWTPYQFATTGSFSHQPMFCYADKPDRRRQDNIKKYIKTNSTNK